jgi:hypothetical protein
MSGATRNESYVIALVEASQARTNAIWRSYDFTRSRQLSRVDIEVIDRFKLDRGVLVVADDSSPARRLTRVRWAPDSRRGASAPLRHCSAVEANPQLFRSPSWRFA